VNINIEVIEMTNETFYMGAANGALPASIDAKCEEDDWATVSTKEHFSRVKQEFVKYDSDEAIGYDAWVTAQRNPLLAGILDGMYRLLSKGSLFDHGEQIGNNYQWHDDDKVHLFPKRVR